MKIDQEFFWTDLKIVIGYISNDSKKFQVYVANRVREMRQQTNPLQWHHVSGDLNPADIASRGMRCETLQRSIWFTGPKFLQKEEALKDTISKGKQLVCNIDDNDPEVKKVKQIKATNLSQLRDMYQKFAIYGDFQKLRTSIAYLNGIAKRRAFEMPSITPKDLDAAETFIVKVTQQRHFQEEINQLKSTGKVRKDSKLRAIDPQLDENGILRVGGRSDKSSTLSQREKHPVIIPKDSHVAILIVREYHTKVHHQGRNFTISAIRTAGFWITGLQALVRSLLSRCITCLKIRKVPTCRRWVYCHKRE